MDDYENRLTGSQNLGIIIEAATSDTEDQDKTVYITFGSQVYKGKSLGLVLLGITNWYNEWHVELILERTRTGMSPDEFYYKFHELVNVYKNKCTSEKFDVLAQILSDNELEIFVP